ncbi:MAG TPA: hypothetical protein VH247_03650 [Thermoleophilaceae bacterium]|jgi:hypothetical protein|nr:hypothetical protein [Thermoleophilaceae bacterium]
MSPIARAAGACLLAAALVLAPAADAKKRTQRMRMGVIRKEFV